jgi:hypothetical protein
LLQKEFCNKYYLATHKATKHGIGSALYNSQLNNNDMTNFLNDTMTQNNNNQMKLPSFEAQQIMSLPPNILNALSPALLAALLRQQQQQQIAQNDADEV